MLSYPKSIDITPQKHSFYIPKTMIKHPKNTDFPLISITVTTNDSKDNSKTKLLGLWKQT